MLPRFSFQSALVSFIVIAVIALVAFGIGRFTSPKFTQYIDTRTAAPTAKEQKTMNQSFDFAVKDNKGVEISKIKYVLNTAVIQDQIIIQGTRATAIKGKTFLIINFSITNNSNKYIQLNSRDYVRLVGNNGELIAPDIHNDPIQVQPISTKESRLGFPVDDTIKNFTLSVGEVDGKKTTVALNF